MIRFIRQIRRNSLKESNSRWYLIYALGEIFLVVAGILIALQINNWNEDRKTVKLELQFLRKLHDDLVTDTVYYNGRIQEAESTMKKMYEFIHKSYEIQNSLEDYKNLMSQSDWPSVDFILENPTYEELKNTGQLHIFKNTALKNDIVSLYRDQEMAAIHISQMNELTRVELYKIHRFITKYAVRFAYFFDQEYMYRDNEWEFINDPNSEVFKNLEATACLYSFKHDIFLEHFEELNGNTRLLIDQINEELKQRD